MFAAVRLSVTPDDVRARPGDRVSLTLTVKNASTNVERYRIALSGIPTAWYTIEPDTVSLFPDAGAPVRINLNPPAGTAAAGTYPLTITATSERDPSLQTSILTTLTVARQGGLRLSISPAAASGTQATYHVSVRNDANAAATVALLPRDLEGGLLFHLAGDGPITVPPGEERTVALRVVPAVAATVGQPMLYDLEVRGVPEGSTEGAAADPALLGQASFTYLPRVRAGSLPAAVRKLPLWALLLLPVALLGAVFLAGTRTAGALTGASATQLPTATQVPSTTSTPIPSATVTPRPSVTRTVAPAPRILRFDVAPGPLGALVVHWATTGAKAVRLNGKQAAPMGTTTLPANTETTMVLAVSGPGGTSTRTLIVTPGAGAAPGAPSGVAAYLPVVQAFTAAQGASGAVLRWQVTGANAVRVDGKPVGTTGQTPLLPGGGIHTLVAANRYGSVTSSLAVPTVSASPQQVQLILHPPSIDRFSLDRAGSGYRLTWQVTGATSVLLNGKRVGAGGALPIGNPQQGTVFDLVASNADGASHAQQRVALSGGSVPPLNAPAPLLLPRITTFALAQSGGQLMVTWRVVGADRVAVDGKPQPSSGSLPVPPGATAVTLVAGNAVGVRQRQVSVPGPSPTALPTEVPSPTPTTAPAATIAPTGTGTAAPSATGTRPVPTHTATARPGVPTHTATPPPGATQTATPPPGAPSTATAVPTGTAIPTSTHATSPTSTAVRRQQGLSVPTFTHTPTPRATQTATVPRPLVWTRTPTVGPAIGPSSTASATAIPGVSATATPITPSATSTSKPNAPVVATGTATTPPTNTATSTATASPSVTVTPTATATATLPPSAVTVAPASVHFPSGSTGAAGFAQQPVTVTNPGPSKVTISGVSITGTDAAAFGQSGCQGTTLDPNKNCTINISFNAATSDQGDAQGNYSAKLVVTDDGSNSPQTVALTAGPRTISVAPPQVTLGIAVPTESNGSDSRPADAVTASAPNAAAAAPLQATVTVTNNGPGPLPNVLASFQPGGNGFTAQVDPACQNLAQGGNCAVTITFAPAPGLTNIPSTSLVVAPQGGTGSVSIPISFSRASTSTIGDYVNSVPYSLSSHNVNLVAFVSYGFGTGVDEGTVTFTVNGTSVTSGPISNGTATANYTVPAGLAVGSYPIQAVYNPGPLFNGSTNYNQPALTIIPAGTTTTAKDASVTAIQSSQNVTLNATVTCNSPCSGPVNEGTVTFTVTDPNSGGQTSTTSGTVSNGNASITYSVPSCDEGTFTIQAVYNPSTNLITSRGNATLTVQPSGYCNG